MEAGEIHALLGGNGSGKSTLIKILAGVERADSGSIAMGGRQYGPTQLTPADAEECGMRFIHQQGSTFSTLTVTENLSAGVGFPHGRTGTIDWRAARRHAQGLIDRYGIDARPDDQLADLRAVSQQMVAIARALQGRDDVHEGVLVLDEPTAALPSGDVAALHDALRSYAGAGQSVLYVTHRLEELPGFVHRATVLRDGRVAGRLDGAHVEHDRLVELMSGSALVSSVPVAQGDSEHADARRRERLVVEGLSGGPVQAATLRVGSGEIVGLAGLVGSGRSSLLEMVFGVRQPVAGTILVDGEPLHASEGRPHPGVAFVPENRIQDASFLPLTVTENLMAASTRSHFRAARIRHREETAEARTLTTEHGIKTESVAAPFNSLSGGNQQKAVLARWLVRRPSLLLLDEPTQGVDVSARAAIHNTIREAAAAGAAAVIASSEAEELAALCDRVVVIVNGRTVREVTGDELAPENLERLSYGKAGRDE